MLPAVILKFGSSVLKTPADLPAAVDEVYRRLRDGHRVLAVVSAFAGVTDELLTRARTALGADAAPEAVAAYVATGEQQSAALLTGALTRAGVPARLLDPRQIELRVAGPPLESDPVAVNSALLTTLWTTTSVLVLPGFFGMGAEGQVSLLGRGGSDLSALFLADALSAECHLVKDVPGVFDQDPARAGPAARRYTEIPWRDAGAVAGPLIQPKALKFAATRGIPFTVSRANGARETRIAHVLAPIYAPHEPAPPRLRVALLGGGTVGGGVYERLAQMRDHCELLAVITRHRDALLALGIHPTIAGQRLERALQPDIDVIIECIGGIEPAASLLLTALQQGKHVISANKAALAQHWLKFAPFATNSNRRLWHSAAVGGAVPILERLDALSGLGGCSGRVRRVRGVLNGTCNWVLDKMATRHSFTDAVTQAQHLGYAEADPRCDITGVDSAHKLSLLAERAFGRYVPPDTIATSGIGPHLKPVPARAWRLIANAQLEGDTVALSVAPELMELESYLGQTPGAENRFEITLDNGELIRLRGQGAGRWPTTTAVIADLLEVVRQKRTRETSRIAS